MINAEIESCLTTDEIVLDIATLTLRETQETLASMQLFSECGEYARAQSALEPLLRKVVVMRKSASCIPLKRSNKDLARLMTIEEELRSMNDTLEGAIEYIKARDKKVEA
jgi:hypothetical protein